MNLNPLHNRLIITLIERPTTTKGGIILPNGESLPCLYARVEAIGPKVTMANVGNIIMVYGNDIQRIEVDGILYGHIREDHVVGIYTDKKEVIND